MPSNRPDGTLRGPQSTPEAADWRRNNFDLIRLVAALQVTLNHALTYLHPPSGAAVGMLISLLGLFPGVPVFLIVSGFLVSKSYEHTPVLAEYLRNRCLRVFPGLWVCLVATLGVVALIGVQASTGPTAAWLQWWAEQMTILQARPIPLAERWTIINGSLWTLPLELEFYLLLPALYALMGRARLRTHAVLLGVMLLSLAVQWAVLRYPIDRRTAYTTPALTVAPYLWMFLVGVLLQQEWPRLRPFIAGRAHRWLLGYAIACALMWKLHLLYSSSPMHIQPWPFLLLAPLVVSCAFTGPQLAQRLLRGRDLSYGLYIYHMLVIAGFLAIGVRATWGGVGLILLASLLLAWLSWSYVEYPFLVRKRGALRVLPQQR